MRRGLAPTDIAMGERASWRRTLILAPTLLVLGTALQMARLPNGTAVNTLWAEDGQIFLGQALSHGGWQAIVIPYNNYLHVVPRLLALITSSLPLQWAAVASASEAAAVVTLLGLFIYRAAAGYVRAPALRFVLVVVFVLIPVVGTEIEDNVANLHWYFDMATLWALLWTPATRRDQALASLVCLLAAASDPFGVLLLPLAVVRIVVRRDVRLLPAAAALVAGLGIQAPYLLAQHPPPMHPTFEEFLQVAAVHVLLPFAIGGRLGEMVWDRAQWVAGIPAAAAAVVLLSASVSWKLRRFVLPLAFTLMASLALAALMLLRWSPIFLPRPQGVLSVGPRYFAVTLAWLWTTVAVAVGGGESVRPRPARIASVLCATWLIVLVVADFQAVYPDRTGGPFWSDAVIVATKECRETHAAIVGVVPSPGPAFRFYIPCARLLN